MQKKEPFWRVKRLQDFTEKEWEKVCDKCGKCCLVKVGWFRIRFTKIACPLLDVCSGRCKDYKNRWDTIPDCIKLTPKNLKKYRKFLPKTCAYLWLLKKHTLPPWHPLVSGRKNSLDEFGLSVKNRAIPFCEPEDYGEYIVKWPDL